MEWNADAARLFVADWTDLAEVHHAVGRQRAVDSIGLEGFEAACVSVRSILFSLRGHREEFPRNENRRRRGQI